MKKIKMKVSFVLVEDVETQEEYFKVADEMKSKAFTETNFLEKHARDIENTIKENFTFSISKRGEEIPDMTESNKTYILTFMTIDGGTTWLGMSGGKFNLIPIMATDEDFSGETDGTFKYIGYHVYVYIPHVIKGVNVTSYQDMFRDNASTTLKGVASDNLNITDMSSMFRDSQATSLNLSSFDTSNVTNMAYMFYNSQVTTLDLSSFDTSSVTNMLGMFQSSLATTLDLSNFDTSSVTNMGYMFYNSKATTGYARTQADADRFNASSNKPAGLTFVVK